MPDTRLAMREFRFLDEKRKLTTLSGNEELRWRELKQVLGVAEARPPSTPPPPQSPDANGHSALGGSEPSGLDFNPDQMYGGAPAAPILGSTTPQYAPYATPGYGQAPPANPDPYRIDQSPAEAPTLSAAELLGLMEPASPPAPTPADIPSENPAEAPPQIGDLAEVGAEDVIELDSSDVTLLETEGDQAQAAIPVPETPPPRSEPEPALSPGELPTEASVAEAQPSPEVPAEIAAPVAATAIPETSNQDPEVSEEITIDLSSAEAIDTGEFAPARSAPAEQPPAIEMASEGADGFDQSAGGIDADGRIAAPAFTQAPVALEEQQSTVPTSLVPGEHRVIIHTHEGQVRRGVIRDADLWAHSITLEHSGRAEALPTDRIKAIFFMVPGGVGQAAPTGQKVRVTLADGRQVVGFSTDFRSEAPGFFLVPADVRTNTSRVYLFRSSVDLITEE